MSIVISGDISANSNKITSIVIDYSYLGTSNADILTGFNGANGELWAHDLIDGGEGNDFIGGGGAVGVSSCAAFSDLRTSFSVGRYDP